MLHVAEHFREWIIPLSNESSGPASALGGRLAREAEPLRRSLTRYFQLRVRETGDVEDLVQEVFARIVARDSPRPVENLAGYVFQTAASVLADRGRRRSSRHADAHQTFDPDHHGDDKLDPERVLSSKESLRAATAALLSLPERTRTIFVLHRLEGYKHREISEQLGISVSAVEKQIIRAVQHLAKTLGKKHGS
ncbi:MAG: RNA polymerase sigma-70 factor, ECF subfamily [uncultured Chloroflexia bacterium]|uniref:RNA polymerase sigma-70 factor, ECF subfamily n=1 Tax=uncultured Chloroflexia bacterium TaxID=1672391 RepID=A0A6J4M5P6_9CHLR|nr:MAG: RNA polymerase sigma-70 factor, ECF subfamily [uncultured Chloroflexia bacterium]